MALKVRRTGAEEYGSRIKMLVAGEPGAGKTLFSSTAPGVLYASAEAGLMSVADRKVPYIDVKSSDDLAWLVRTLDLSPQQREQELGGEIKTVVIDTIDEVQRIFSKERQASQKKDSLTIADFGWLGDQLRSLVRGFRNLDLNVIFCVHLKTSEDSETGRITEKPGLQGALADELAAYVDMALLLQSRTVTHQVDGEVQRSTVRFLQTYPDLRHPWIKDRSGKLPQELELNFQDDFSRILRFVLGNEGAPDLEPSEDIRVIEDEAPETPKVKAPPKGQKVLKLEEPRKLLDTSEDKAPSPAPRAETTTVVLEPPRETAGQEAVASPGNTTETSVSQNESVAGPATSANDMTCAGCGGQIETPEQRELSSIRWRKPLCRACHKQQGTRRK